MKIAVVVQRYGADINGGAELHARYLAEHLSRHVQVEVLTTCAKDYITWADAYPAGPSTEGSIAVRRFSVTRPRDPQTFGAWSERVFGSRHSINDELAWLDAEGPTSSSLVRYIADHEAAYDYFLFFSFRYYHAYHGARTVPGKAILVPTAERDEALGLGIFPAVLRSVRAFMYNSPEEQRLLQAVAGTSAVPGVVVGIGSDVPPSSNPSRFRQRSSIHGRTAIYIGRIDENKGCAELFDFWKRYSEITPGGLTLVLVGHPVLPVPDHPRIKHIGFVSDQEKYDALAAAEFLIMPSYFESLSMVALEAWALGKPVLANGKCDVLRGQAIRSNAALYYDSYAEFVEAVRVLDSSTTVAAALGRNGSAFFRSHYAWPVIERKYLDMFDRLTRQGADAPASGTVPPLPGWWARRQKTLAPAREVLAGLPSGPVMPNRFGRSAPAGPSGRMPEPRPSRREEERPARREEERSRPREDDRSRWRDDERSRLRDGGRARVADDGNAPSRDDGRAPSRTDPRVQAREGRPGRPASVAVAPPPASEGGQGRGRGPNRGRRMRRAHGRPARKGGA